MKFLADENVEWPVVQALRQKGHDVKAVGEVSAGTDDETVILLKNPQRKKWSSCNICLSFMEGNSLDILRL